MHAVFNNRHMLTCSSFCCKIFSSRVTWRRSFSRAFSVLSTRSTGSVSAKVKYSSNRVCSQPRCQVTFHVTLSLQHKSDPGLPGHPTARSVSCLMAKLWCRPNAVFTLHPPLSLLLSPLPPFPITPVAFPIQVPVSVRLWACLQRSSST